MPEEGIWTTIVSYSRFCWEDVRGGGRVQREMHFVSPLPPPLPRHFAPLLRNGSWMTGHTDPTESWSRTVCSARHGQSPLLRRFPADVGIEKNGVQLMRDALGGSTQLLKGEATLQMQRGVPGEQLQQPVQLKRSGKPVRLAD